MRRHDIDYLRLLGILLLFPFHAARVFDPYEANYVESAVKSMTGAYFSAIVWPWFMPLMFLIAGVSTWFALQKRTARQFAQERTVRLFVPLVLGIIFIVPIQGYMARLQEGTLRGGYFNYLFTQFFADFSDISGYHGTFTPAHLWFILYLFVISLALVLPFVKIRDGVRAGKNSVMAKLFRKEWFLLILFLPLTVCEALPDLGGKNPFYYALYYFIGYAIAAYGSWETLAKLKWYTLGGAAAALAAYLVMIPYIGGKGDFAWESIVFAILRNLYGSYFLFAMLAFAQKYLHRGGKTLDYLNQAAFPVYILHQSVMMVLAYFIVQWKIAPWLQFVAIVLLSLAASLGLFELCRHFAPTRVLLGIKKAPKKSV